MNVAIVTGAGSGIGRAIAAQLAAIQCQDDRVAELEPGGARGGLAW